MPCGECELMQEFDLESMLTYRSSFQNIKLYMTSASKIAWKSRFLTFGPQPISDMSPRINVNKIRYSDWLSATASQLATCPHFNVNKIAIISLFKLKRVIKLAF
jgi:hypothetical protein